MSRSNLKLAVSPPSARSTARADLAAAIAARNAATARLERVKKAEDTLNSKIYAAYPAIEAAEARVIEAKEKAPAFIVAQVLGEANDADAPISTKQAQAELQLVQDDLENLRSAREPLKTELGECEQDVRHAEWKLRERIGDAVAADSATVALLDRFAAAAREFLGCRKALEMLSSREALPEGTRWLQHAYENVGDAIFNEWQAALAALETNADAPLPTV
jgi:chromosome segregation ATPase